MRAGVDGRTLLSITEQNVESGHELHTSSVEMRVLMVSYSLLLTIWVLLVSSILLGVEI